MQLVLTVLRCPDQVPPETRTVTGGEYSVGRGPGVDWILPDPERMLSKQHFAVAFRGGAWQIADTSTNGTTMNRDPAPIGRGEVRTLRDGDRLTLGAYEIECRLEQDSMAHAGPAVGMGTGFGATAPSGGGGSPFGDPFGRPDPFAPPPPAHTPFNEGPAHSLGLMQSGAQLPHDFDPLAPEPGDALFAGPTQADHAPAMDEAFRPPQPIGQMSMGGGALPADDLLPDDWDKDLLEGINPQIGSMPSGGAAPMASPPMPAAPITPPPAAHAIPAAPVSPPIAHPAAAAMPHPAMPAHDTPSPFAQPGEAPVVQVVVQPVVQPIVQPLAQAGIQPVVQPGVAPAHPIGEPIAPPMVHPMGEPIAPATAPTARRVPGAELNPFAEEGDQAAPPNPFARSHAAPVEAPPSPFQSAPTPFHEQPAQAAAPAQSAASPFDEPFDLSPPMPAAPVEAPTPARRPAPATATPAAAVPAAAVPLAAGDDALLAAFLAGVGLDDAHPKDPAGMMHGLGEAFRVLVSGLRAVLIARASIKSEFRIEQTMIRARGNNPLKFSAGDDDALSALLGTGRRTDMTPAAAVADALKDIRLHELASMAAMQSAVRTLLEGLDPAKLRAQAEQGGGLSVIPAQRKARAWDAYEALHQKTVQALSDDFDSVFGKAFARAYERALEDVSARER